MLKFLLLYLIAILVLGWMWQQLLSYADFKLRLWRYQRRYRQ